MGIRGVCCLGFDSLRYLGLFCALRLSDFPTASLETKRTQKSAEIPNVSPITRRCFGPNALDTVATFWLNAGVFPLNFGFRILQSVGRTSPVSSF